MTILMKDLFSEGISAEEHTPSCESSLLTRARPALRFGKDFLVCLWWAYGAMPLHLFPGHSVLLVWKCLGTLWSELLVRQVEISSLPWTYNGIAPSVVWFFGSFFPSDSSSHHNTHEQPIIQVHIKSIQNQVSQKCTHGAVCPCVSIPPPLFPMPTSHPSLPRLRTPRGTATYVTRFHCHLPQIFPLSTAPGYTPGFCPPSKLELFMSISISSRTTQLPQPSVYI